MTAEGTMMAAEGTNWRRVEGTKAGGTTHGNTEDIGNRRMAGMQMIGWAMVIGAGHHPLATTKAVNAEAG